MARCVGGGGLTCSCVLRALVQRCFLRRSSLAQHACIGFQARCLGLLAFSLTQSRLPAALPDLLVDVCQSLLLHTDNSILQSAYIIITHTQPPVYRMLLAVCAKPRSAA